MHEWSPKHFCFSNGILRSLLSSDLRTEGFPISFFFPFFFARTLQWWLPEIQRGSRTSFPWKERRAGLFRGRLIWAAAHTLTSLVVVFTHLCHRQSVSCWKMLPLFRGWQLQKAVCAALIHAGGFPGQHLDTVFHPQQPGTLISCRNSECKECFAGTRPQGARGKGFHT